MTDENETLTIVTMMGAVAVDDAEGGRWFPSDDAMDEIEAAEDQAATLLRICREEPWRGEWRQ